MQWIDGLRLKRRRKWDRVDATLVDSRFAKQVADGTASGTFQVWEYMVDVPGPSGGAPVRLTFKEKAFKVRGELKSGRVVPVVVNRKRTKVMFNFADPRIDEHGRLNGLHRKREQDDDARFAARRQGREPPPGTENELA